MSNVWCCIPSARPAPVVDAWCERWHAQGYKIALWRDTEEIAAADMCIVGGYPGYPVAANRLIAQVLEGDISCDWVVCCGDDTWPDPNKRADEIALECTRYFFERGDIVCHSAASLLRGDLRPTEGTFGVMQPCGDTWADGQGRIIERICGSPWLGREFCRRINQGNGPWWNQYWHSWADEEMQNVTQQLGILWQRRDVTHFHDHCCRYPGGKWAPHLQGVSEDYKRMKPLFDSRKKLGFPGSEPL